ncbi:MAG: terminase family protein [Chloroflexota bacterium]
MPRQIELTLPAMHPAQLEVFNCPARYRVLSKGRRFGGSMLGAIEAVACASQRGQVWYVCPSFPMATERWTELCILARQYPETTILEGPRSITFPGGGKITVKSAHEPNSLRGSGLDLIVLDEAAYIQDLLKLFGEVLLPTLLDRKGRALFISSPNGLNAFRTLFVRGLDPLKPSWESFTFGTASNPYVSTDDVAAMRSEMTEMQAMQELDAQFVDFNGSVFRRLNEVCVLKPQRGPQAEHVYTMGIDWGRSGDYTAISVFDSTSRQQAYLDRFTDTAWAMQRNRIKALYRYWEPERVIAESNSIGGPNIEALQAEGIRVKPFATTAQSKPLLIEAMALAIERGALGEQDGVLLLDNPVQLAELQAYAMERLASGRFTYNAPAGQHDDTVIATALSLHGARSTGPMFAFVNLGRGSSPNSRPGPDVYNPATKTKMSPAQLAAWNQKMNHDCDTDSDNAQYWQPGRIR